MRKFLLVVLTALVLTPVGAPASAPAIAAQLPPAGLIIDDTLAGSLTPQDLADTLLGTGVTISNVSYTGANAAAGA